MNSIANVINEENLIALNFNSSPISTVLNEILVLFKEQQAKIKQIEEVLKDKVDKTTHEKLYNEVGSLNDECSLEFAELRKKITEFKRENDNQVKDIKEQQDIDKLEILAETRRLITTEIKQVSYDDQLSKLSEKIRLDEEMISKMNNDIDSLAYSTPTPTTSSNSNSGVNPAVLIKFERQIKEIEKNIETYPTIEKNVNELMINFPLITKKLERKVNDLLEKEKNKDLGKMPSRPFSTSSNDNGSQLSSFRPNNSNYSNNYNYNDLPEQMPAKPVVEYTSLPQTTSTIDIQLSSRVDDDKEEEEKGEEKASNNEGDSTERDSSRSKTLKLSSIPKSKRRSLENISARYNRESKDDTKVIKVIENKTYKTEMNSSLRVVSELEWLNNLIQQHHEAIRSLQQKTRTQQENFDAVVESLTRVNSTNNTRISQIAQQVSNVKNDNEALQKKTGEQISKMFGIISELNSQIENIPKEVKVSKQTSETDDAESAKTAKITSEKSDRLQRLKDKFNINFGFEEDEDNENNENENINDEEENENESERVENNTDINTNPKSLDNQDNKQKHRLDGINLEGLSGSPDQPKRKFEFQFRLCHFSINSVYNSFMVSEIRTINERSRTRIKPIELFSSNSYFENPIKQPQQPSVEKHTPIENEKSTDITTIKETQSNLSYNSTQTIPNTEVIAQTITTNTNTTTSQNDTYVPRFDQFNLNSTDFLALGKAPKREIHEITVEDVPTEIIEEKVSVYARRVVAILVDSAKKDFKEEQANLQKTVDQFVSQIDNKIDREFVERMFNKFRNAMNEMNEKIDNLQCSFLEWVTRDELEMVLNNFVKVISDVKDTAASKSKYNCLLCGRPRQHLAGMMVTGLKSTNSSVDSNNTTKSIERRSVDSNIITKPIVPASKVIQ